MKNSCKMSNHHPWQLTIDILSYFCHRWESQVFNRESISNLPMINVSRDSRGVLFLSLASCSAIHGPKFDFATCNAGGKSNWVCLLSLFPGHVLFTTGIGALGSVTNSEFINFNGSQSCPISDYPIALAYAGGLVWPDFLSIADLSFEISKS